MSKKFVLNNNKLVLGEVTYHCELCADNSKTIGGGRWYIEDNKLILYGSSTEFGPVTEEQVMKAQKPLGMDTIEIVVLQPTL